MSHSPPPGDLGDAEIFERALSLRPEDRRAFVEAACGRDRGRRDMLLKMLSVSDEPSLEFQAPSLDEVPTKIGHYKIREELGHGGMGIVYRAWDPKLRRHVALKILPPHVAHDPRRLERFEREAQLPASISHPNIATVYTIERAGDVPFLTMEYAAGHSLADTLRPASSFMESDQSGTETEHCPSRTGIPKPIPLRETLGICLQITHALEAAHGAGVVHRDLKPANVVVASDGSVKVIDFGIAKALARAEPEILPHRGAPPTVTTALGTLPYASPEQLRREPTDHRTDIWSFGCIVYECLTGQHAIRVNARDLGDEEGGAGVSTADASDVSEVLQRNSMDILPDGTPPRVGDLISRCLETEPENRPDSMTEVRHLIEEELAALDTPTRLPGIKLWILTAFVTLILLVTAWVIRDAVMQDIPAAVHLGPIARVDLLNSRTIRAFDANGTPLWTQELPDAVLLNQVGPLVDGKPLMTRELLVVKGGEGPLGVAVATLPEFGPGRIWFLNARDGEPLWFRDLEWEDPVNPAHMKRPVSVWQVSVDWKGTPALGLGIQNHKWYSSAVQFMALDGEILATYYHPGYLFFAGEADLDGDGDPSIILFGDNSSARFDRDLVPFETDMHCGCIVLLEPPNIGGQAYPYSEYGVERDWPGMVRAREEAYLLVPPLDAQTEATITRIDVVLTEGQATLEARVVDGRVYLLDFDLHTESCYVPPATDAWVALDRKDEPLSPLLHIRSGEPQKIRDPAGGQPTP